MRTLTVAFETEPDAVRELLPPPLEPATEPVGIAWAGDVGSSTCVGPFASAGLAVRARYQDIIGYYCLRSTRAVTFGREIYGEPRKLAKIIFESQDEHVWGSAERHEIRYLSVRGRCTDPAPTGRQESNMFFFKFLPRPDGSGFDSTPKLVVVTRDFSITSARRAGAHLPRRSPDPLIDIPVRR
jgi:acetoacetate decarboxylase